MARRPNRRRCAPRSVGSTRRSVRAKPAMTMGGYGYNPQASQLLLTQAQGAAQSAYQQGMLQYNNDQLAFQMANAAYTQALNQSAAFGYAAGGDWTSLGSLAANAPPPGTPLQSTMNTLGSGGGIPGLTGFNTGQTLNAQQQYANQAAQQAGITGIYNAPTQSQYSPGTWVQVDPSQLPAGQGQQLAYVQPNGQLQRVTGTQATAMGYRPGMETSVPYEQFMALSQAPPTGLPQLSLQAQQQYQAMNSAANQNALATAQATGWYQAPAPILAPGTANDGSSFYQQPQNVRQPYVNVYHDSNTALQAWLNDTNASINQGRAAQGLAPLDAYGSAG